MISQVQQKGCLADSRSVPHHTGPRPPQAKDDAVENVQEVGPQFDAHAIIDGRALDNRNVLVEIVEGPQIAVSPWAVAKSPWSRILPSFAIQYEIPIGFEITTMASAS